MAALLIFSTWGNKPRVRTLIAILVILSLIIVGIVFLMSRSDLWSRARLSSPTATPTSSISSTSLTATPLPATATAPGTPTVVPSATPRQTLPTPTASPPNPVSFLADLQAIPIPQRDLAALAARLKPAPTATPAGMTAGNRVVGSKQVFWVTDMDSMTHFTVTATLRHVSEHLYMYVDDTIAGITTDALRSAADVFETRTYPTTRYYLGTAWKPGLDGDERISVLHVKQLGATGAFSAADEESTLGNPYSNGRHMIYMNVQQVQPGTRIYDSVLAHEFQHAIHFFQDRNEDAWVNEGASVLNEKLNGYSTRSAIDAFVSYPDTQLTTWGDDPDLGAHYGAAFLFLNYFHQRYGDQALRLLIENSANGAEGFDQVLALLGSSDRFGDVFADWIVANALDDPVIGDGRYHHADISLRLAPSARHPSLPRDVSTNRPQFAAYYAEINIPAGGAHVFFTGTTTTKLVNNDPHSGMYQWWSNRSDLMDTTLTRRFDLSGVTSATLSFWTWYDIEEDWDYAYVMVSADNGHTWSSLPTRYTTSTNPVGNNLGNGYTGKSGGRKEARWVEDHADLTPYAGKSILIRFEYVTDDAVVLPGFCVDDIAIPQLGFYDNAESKNAWEAQGFVHSSNTIPQSYVVRTVTFGQETAVQTVPVDARGYARMIISGGQRALLIIAGTAPITTEKAVFQYTITTEE